jgi:hypothetical protein
LSGKRFTSLRRCAAVTELGQLKSAVLKADWFDPEINPKLADFCRHYRIHVMPCRPAKPQHKGKVERGVAYLRANALKGRRFKSLAEENLFLACWESQVADKRIHGTTRKQVAACFEQQRPYLQALPESLFPSFQEAKRSVHRDSYVEVARAYYEVPAELIGHQVWVRWDSRSVRVFNQKMEQVQIHSRVEPGRFSHVLGARGLHAPVLSSCRYWISRAATIGEECGQWAQGAFELCGAQALRSIMGLCALNKQHCANAINSACSKALKPDLGAVYYNRGNTYKDLGNPRAAYADLKKAKKLGFHSKLTNRTRLLLTARSSPLGILVRSRPSRS